MNKKSIVQSSIVGILLIVITFFLVGNFLFSTTKTLTTSSQDLACRTFVTAKDSTYVKLAEEFLGTLNQKCAMDKVSQDFKSKEDTFEVTSDMMQKCWYRYGEGKYDFLSNVNTEGNWCFTCAKIDFKDGDEVYQYQEFVEDLKNRKIMVKNDQGVEVEKTLYEYLNVQYADLDNMDKMYEIKSQIDAILEENEPSLNRLALQVNHEYEYIMDLRLKEIDTGEPLYVVFRYDKPDDRILDSTNQALIGAMGGMLTGMAASAVASWAVETAAYAATGAVIGSVVPVVGTAIGGVLGGTLGAVVNIFKKGIKISDKVIGLMGKLKDVRAKLSKIRRVSQLAGIGEEVIEFSGKLHTQDILKIIEKVEKNFPDLAKKYDKLHKDLTKLGVQNIDDLDDIILKADEKYIKDSMFSAFEVMNDPKIKNSFEATEDILRKQGADLDELRKLKNEMETIGNTNFDELIKTAEGKKNMAKYIKNTFVIATATASGSMIATDLNFYNYEYVDILTEEQFYRTCGTHSYIPE